MKLEQGGLAMRLHLKQIIDDALSGGFADLVQMNHVAKLNEISMRELSPGLYRMFTKQLIP